MKITFLEAGSIVFARNVIGDCMCSEVLRDSIFALYDIDVERLEQSRVILEKMRETMGGHGSIECYCGEETRKDALRDASFVINAIQVGGYEPSTVIDFEIPKKYGLCQTIGLCHSVQVCVKELFNELGMEDKIEGHKELIAGINHMGFK